MKKFTQFFIILLSFLTLGAWNNEAFGQSYHNGTWYSYYDDNTHTMNTQGDWDTGSNIYAPTAGTLNGGELLEKLIQRFWNPQMAEVILTR